MYGPAARPGTGHQPQDTFAAWLLGRPDRFWVERGAKCDAPGERSLQREWSTVEASSRGVQSKR